MFMLFTGWLITHFFCTTCPDNMEDTELYKHYGYNNACVVLDFAPSIYFMPTIWACVMTAWIASVTLHLMRARACWRQGLLSSCRYCFACVTSWIEVLSLFFFSTCLAVHPYSNFELVLHTLPFTVIMQALNLHSVAFVFIGYSSGYYARLGLDTCCMKWCLGIFLSVSTIVFALKGQYELVHMFSTIPPTSQQASYGKTLDTLSLFFGGTPVLFNAYLLCCKRDALQGFVLHLAIPRKIATATD